MGLCLYVGNRNYSSWSMRPGVLLRAFDIPFEEKLIRFDSFAPDSQLKKTAPTLTPTGNVPILIDSDVQSRRGAPLVINDTLSIFEYIAEKYPDLSLWPNDVALRTQACNLCAEMHSGFTALRNHCAMNIGPDLSQAGAIIWRDQPSVRADVARIEAAWAECMELSGGPFLCGGFSAVDAYFAPVVMRLKYYGLPVSQQTTQSYISAVCVHPAVNAWVDQAIATAEFLSFEEPYRLAADAAPIGT
ncbi:glutathione S-transferase [Rhodobacteraceae bacterium nBUS_24]